jgi:two-component system, cell cycle sensor histidine kinase and response regulator CckA
MELTSTPSTPTARQVPEPARKCVLIVDDERTVLEVTARMLEAAGYLVIEASNAREALRLLERGDPPINLVITDVVMPETDGRALGRLIAERHLGLPVAYMSAYPADDVLHRGSPGPNLPFLRKPFSPEALVGVVQQLLGKEASEGHATPA